MNDSQLTAAAALQGTATVTDAGSNPLWMQLDRELDRLLDLDEEARQQRLEELAGDSPITAQRLQRMLAMAVASEPLEHLAVSEIAGEALSSLPGLGLGDKVGDWTLMAEAGRGGMAEVFVAERQFPGGRQRAALKMMQRGLFGTLQQHRFQRETAILASLEDPRIARLLDAGTCDDGRPWLAMEYVDGVRIDEACDRRQLTLQERVRWIIDIAEAVDYAHRQLIVHRDIKPGNILIDNDGRPRLLDFGIARTLVGEHEPSSDTAMTATDMRAFTPRYASPEQLSGLSAGIAGDVYQLGLLSYELLVGKHPFAGVHQDPALLLGAMNKGAPLPSQAAASLENVTAVARATTPRRLAQQLRGDLDSILLHALEAEPQRRYRDARELAEDLQRWLDGLPVRVRGYSRTHRVARYLRRHWLGSSAVALIAALVVAYAVTLTLHSARLEMQRNHAEQAQLRAESMHGFLLRVFASADPNLSDSHGKSLEQLLIEAVEQAPLEFSDQPLVAAELLGNLSQVLLRRGRFEVAEQAIRTAIAIRETELGVEHSDTLDMLTALFDVLLHQGRLEEAYQLKQRQHEGIERTVGSQSLLAINSLLGLAMLDARLQQYDQALARLAAATTTHRQVYGPPPWEDSDVAVMYEDLEHQRGLVLLSANRLDQAEPILATATEAWSRRFGAEDQRTLTARKNWANALLRGGKLDQAREQFELILQAERAMVDGPQLRVAYTLGMLALVERDRTQHEASAQLWLQAATEALAATGPDHPWHSVARMRAAEEWLKAGQPQQARPLLHAVAALENRSDDLAQRAGEHLATLGDE